MTSEKKEGQRRSEGWKLLFKGELEDFDPNISLDYWLEKTPREKFAEVTDLITQAARLKGINLEDASRLLRTTAVLKRQ